MDNITKWAKDHGRELYYHCLIWHTWCVPNDPPDWEAWIAEAMERNPTAHDIEVVNEGYSPLGDRTFFYIEDAYRLTRQLRPTARLWYNGLLDEQGEQDQVLRLISEGLVDAVGIQAHLNLYSDVSKFDYLLQRLTVPWAITELDVIVPVDSDYYRGLQALVYRDVVGMAHDYGAEWIALWECVDKYSWQAASFPTPNDGLYQPKPAMTELKR
jgi:GH35 family endo-1,4-beta-xylanase